MELMVSVDTMVAVIIGVIAITLAIVGLFVTIAVQVGKWIAKREERKLEAFFRAWRVDEIQREKNSCKVFQSIAQKHLELHYSKMWEAIKSHDHNAILDAYRQVSVALRELKDGNRQIQEKVQERLDKAQEEYCKAKLRSQSLF